MELSRSQAKIATTVLLCVFMCGTLSLTMTAYNTGFGSDFLGRWMRNFAVSFVVALPAFSVVGPSIRRLVERHTATDTSGK